MDASCCSSNALYESGLIFTSKSPFFTGFPSSTGNSMISPATSGEIFTSVSGCTFPVAETVCRIVLRTAFSVMTGIGFSRLLLMIEMMIRRTRRPIEPKMILRFRLARRFRGDGAVSVVCSG